MLSDVTIVRVLSCFIKKERYILNPLSVNVAYTPHEGDVTCSRCGASNGLCVFERGENLLQNRVKSYEQKCGREGGGIRVKPIARNRCAKVEFTQTKTDFSKRAWHLKG